MPMAKNIFKVPVSIKANTRKALTRKCLLNNRINNIMFGYNVVFDGNSWVAWFNADITKLSRVK